MRKIIRNIFTPDALLAALIILLALFITACLVVSRTAVYDVCRARLPELSQLQCLSLPTGAIVAPEGKR